MSRMNTLLQPQVFLITGVMASGKSTVAQHLAEYLEPSVHLRGDVFRRMIVNGQAEMSLTLSTRAYAQLTLRYQIAAAAVQLYFQAGFHVVYQDIILGQDLWQVARYYHTYPLHVIVLCPDAAEVARREAGRKKTGYAHRDEIEAFDHLLRTATPRIGLWLDNTRQTAAETVTAILENLDQSRVSRID